MFKVHHHSWESEKLSLCSCNGLDLFLVQMLPLFTGYPAVIIFLREEEMQEMNGVDAALSSISLPAALGWGHMKPKMKRDFMWFGYGALPQFPAAFLHLTLM